MTCASCRRTPPRTGRRRRDPPPALSFVGGPSDVPAAVAGAAVVVGVVIPAVGLRDRGGVGPLLVLALGGGRWAVGADWRALRDPTRRERKQRSGDSAYVGGPALHVELPSSF